MTKIQINQVDAFTDKLFGGNPAGVCFDADQLTEEEMRKIAREMNLSETAFILESENSKADFRLRYFTPEAEVKFCGHATIGALHELAHENELDMDKEGEYEFKIETGAGVLDMKVIKKDKNIKVEFDSTKIELINSKYSHEQFAKKLGIDLNTLDQTKPIMEDKTLNYIYVTIKDLKTLGDLEFDFNKIKSEFKHDRFVVFCLMTPETFDPKNDIHARGLAPLVGVDEDPVTGSMQGALAAYANLNDLTQKKEIGVEQGNFVGRPGSLSTKITKTKDKYSARIIATAKHVFSTEIIID